MHCGIYSPASTHVVIPLLYSELLFISFHDFVPIPPLYTSTLGIMSNTHIDPSLGQSGDIDDDIPIDPALFAIEQIVNDARKNKDRLAGEDEARRAAAHSPIQVTEQEEEVLNEGGEDAGIGMLDEEFDPALREIVNSLTNAQQVCNLSIMELMVVNEYDGR